MTVDLTGTHSEEEAVERITQYAARTVKGQWIRGRGWDQNDWPTKLFPTKASLERIAPNTPMYLLRVDGHACWVNRRTLEIAGVNRMTPDPPGGKILRDAHGEPTGVLLDAAMESIYRFVPEPSEQEMREAVHRATNECASVGLTSVHEMGVDRIQVNLYKKMIDEDVFPLRVYGAVDGPGEFWDTMKKEGKLLGYGNKKLSIGALKLYVD
jgi:hypothetical protein